MTLRNEHGRAFYELDVLRLRADVRDMVPPGCSYSVLSEDFTPMVGLFVPGAVEHHVFIAPGWREVQLDNAWWQEFCRILGIS